MNIWILLQIVVNLSLALGVVVMWLRLKRPPKDDPRLSRGLQLLQSKISVLEDLSDRTDRQVKQLSDLLDQKSRLLQNKIFDSEKQVQKLDQSMFKSMEVAQIFQDKIPHEEIIERQNTIKYVKAARMAHEGKSNDEIAREVDLPREQIEFIAKVNKDQLMFDESQLPTWAQMGQEVSFGQGEQPTEEYSSLKRIGDEFRQACRDFETKAPVSVAAPASATVSVPLSVPVSAPIASEPSQIVTAAKNITQKLVNTAMNTAQSLATGANTASSVITAGKTRILRDEAPVRPYSFPRIEIEDEDIKL